MNEALLERIQLGLLEEQQLRCRYYAAHQDKERELILNPLALVQRGSITSDCHGRTLQRHPPVRAASIPRGRRAGYAAGPGGGLLPAGLSGQRRATVRRAGANAAAGLVSDTLARMIRETPLSPDMTLEPGEEGFCLQATVRDSWQLRWWLLQQGENICVQAPAALRASLRETLRRALARYE